ncbi:MAG: efflux RND transporter periplasmic adaptor subunit [Firmicutes bacterium]|nr:efflux RND transporter periplasmic adaptor subunit [Bacillota bacterium]MCM1402108.1 efflux RND transporter periplasmic adaptor subunit [Bacteroides sp.]MCM1477513.1 efflux RND transporter periplasmic adaptor subunit [Bacteroides sp.]
MADIDNSKNEQRRESRVLMVSLVLVVLIVAAIAVAGMFLLKPPPEIIEGQAEATSVRISGKLPGRVTEIFVKEGDTVHAGDTLIHIHSSLADAKLYQANEMKKAAAAQNRKVDAGTRSQIIQGAQDIVAQAAAAREITKKTYDRMQNLYNEGVMSTQKRDEAKAAYDAAVAAERAAQSQLSLARAGAQEEDKQSAAAMVGVAQGGVQEVNALLEDQYLVAPCDGEIDQIYPEVGELVSLGTPLMSLLKADDKWVTFNVREDLLSDFKMGKKIKVMIPALDKMETELEVYYIRDMGSYATWRATKSTGEWDSRTFQVKARTTKPVKDLRPGMTVVYR